MIDWQPGDILLCVNDADTSAELPRTCPACPGGEVVRGRLYTCDRVMPPGMRHPLNLRMVNPIWGVDLQEVSPGPFMCQACRSFGWGFEASRFVKLYTPDPQAGLEATMAAEIDRYVFGREAA